MSSRLQKRDLLAGAALLASALALGPAAAVDAGTDIWTRFAGLDDARIRVIVADPLRPGTLYVAAGERGAFGSADGGSNWDTLGPEGTDVRALALDPFQAGRLWVGGRGSGFRRSDDGGATWIASASFSASSINALAADPHQRGRLLAATETQGVLVSSDGGAVWTVATDARGSAAHAVVWDRTRAGRAYAGTLDGVLTSDDGGATWRNASAGLPTLASRRIVSLESAGDATGTLYAGTFAGVWASTNGGDSWDERAGGMPERTTVLGLDLVAGAPGHLWAASPRGLFESTDAGASWRAHDELPGTQSVAVDPLSPGVVYAGTAASGLYASRDGGASWDPSNSALTISINRLAPHPSVPGVLYAATPAGVWTSENGGRGWGRPPADLALEFVYDLAFGTGTDDGGTLWAATHSGRLYTYRDEAWAVAATLPSPLFSVAADAGALFAGTSGAGIWRSGDGGATWTRAGGLGNGIAVNDLIVSAGALWAGTADGVWRSDDRGVTFTRDGAAGVWIECLAVVGDRLLAGAWQAAVLARTGSASGAAWIPSASGMHPQSSVDGIVSHAGAPHLAYAVLGGSTILASEDGGRSWRAFWNGFFTLDVTALAIDPTDAAHLYAGTESHGLYVIERSARSAERLVPAVASGSGAAGATWATDLRIENPNAVAVAARVAFVPRSGSAESSMDVALAAGEERELADVLAALGTQGAGTLRVSTAGTPGPRLRAAAKLRSSASPGAEQWLAAMPPPAAGPPTRWLAGLGDDAAVRINAGVANPGAEPMPVAISVYDAAGSERASEEATLPPFGSWQRALAALAPGVSGPLTLAVTSSGTRPPLAYASLVERQGGRATALVAQRAEKRVLVPGVARSSSVHTRLALANTGAAPLALRLDLAGGGRRRSTTLTLAAHETRFFADALAQLFGVAKSGGVLIAAASEPALAASAWLARGEGAAHLQALPVVTGNDLVPEAWIAGAQIDGEATTTLGLYNPNSWTVTVRVALAGPSEAATLGETSVALAPGAWKQAPLEQLFPAVTGLRGGTLRITASDPGGAARLAIVAARIERASGGATLLPLSD